jgi:hypothetical protein
MSDTVIECITDDEYAAFVERAKVWSDPVFQAFQKRLRKAESVIAFYADQKRRSAAETNNQESRV